MSWRRQGMTRSPFGRQKCHNNTYRIMKICLSTSKNGSVITIGVSYRAAGSRTGTSSERSRLDEALSWWLAGPRTSPKAPTFRNHNSSS